MRIDLLEVRARALVASLAIGAVAGLGTAQPCHRYRVAEFRPLPDDLCLPGGTAHDINGANGLGDFAGAWACAGGNYRPYLSTPDGMIELGGPADSRARDVNVERAVIGSANAHLGYQTVAWIWRKGMLEFIEPDPPMVGTSFVKFVDDDTVLGLVDPAGDDQLWIPALYRLSSGEWEHVGLDIPDVRSARGHAVDSNGVLGGFFDDQDDARDRAFIRHSDGSVELVPTGDDSIIPGAGAVFAVRTDIGLLGGQLRLAGVDPFRPVIWRDGEPGQVSMLDGALGASVTHIHDENTWFGRTDLGFSAWKSTIWRYGRPYRIDSLIDYDPGVPIGIGDLDFVDAAGRLYGLGGIGATTGVMVLEPVPAPPGDMNCDAVVDFDDLLEVLAHWGPCGNDDACPHDINGDQTVDNAEALNVLLHWTP